MILFLLGGCWGAAVGWARWAELGFCQERSEVESELMLSLKDIFDVLAGEVRRVARACGVRRAEGRRLLNWGG